jgi:hypothetical protein
MAKKKKIKEDEEFSESKSDELEKIMEKRTEIESKIEELKRERKEVMQREHNLRIIINTLGGDK